jgi:hypothetical protein
MTAIDKEVSRMFESFQEARQPMWGRRDLDDSGDTDEGRPNETESKERT